MEAARCPFFASGRNRSVVEPAMTASWSAWSRTRPRSNRCTATSASSSDCTPTTPPSTSPRSSWPPRRCSAACSTPSRPPRSRVMCRTGPNAGSALTAVDGSAGRPRGRAPSTRHRGEPRPHMKLRVCSDESVSASVALNPSLASHPISRRVRARSTPHDRCRAGARRPCSTARRRRWIAEPGFR